MEKTMRMVFSWLVRVKSLQSCLILCNSMNCSPPGFSVSGILQARILEWVVISTSRDLPNPGIEPWSLMSSATAEATWEAPVFSWVTRSYSRRILWRVRQEKENIWCGNLFCSKDFRYLTQINWTPASAYSTDEVSISLYTFPSH